MRISYANVVSTLALALVVGGGTAYAAGLVGTDDLRNGAVTTPKIKKNAVVSKKVKNGSLKQIDFAAAERSFKDVELRATTFTFPEDNGATGQVLSETADCLAGETVVSGGYHLSNITSVGGVPNVIVTNSRPAADADGGVPAVGTSPQGWFVQAQRNSDFTDTTVTVWVLCGS